MKCKTQVLNESVVIVDFEMTGLRADRGDRIIEVAALRLQGDQIVARYTSLVDCGMRLSGHIRQLTGITQVMVDNGAPPQQVIPELLRFIGNDTVISHNAAFDQGFLDCECDRLHLARCSADFLCTVQLARALFPKLRSHGLGTLVSAFDLPSISGAHRAGADAQATVNVLLHLSKVVGARYGLDTLDIATLRGIIESTMPYSLNDEAVDQTVTRAA